MEEDIMDCEKEIHKLIKRMEKLEKHDELNHVGKKRGMNGKKPSEQ